MTLKDNDTSQKNIVLICSIGASMGVSLLIESIKKSDTKNSLNLITASPSELNDLLEKHKVSAVLLGPQVMFFRQQLEQKLETIPVDIINRTDYGRMDGEKVFAQIKKLLEF